MSEHMKRFLFLLWSVSLIFNGYAFGRLDAPMMKCECKCEPDHRPKPKPGIGEIHIDENTDIPNNPLKPLTAEEFQKLQDELRNKDKS